MNLSSSGINRFKEEGYTLFKGLFSKTETDVIKYEYERHWLQLLYEGSLVKEQITSKENIFPRMRDYHRHNKNIREFVLDSRIMEPVEKLINEPPLIVATTYYFKIPGEKGYPNHQDNFALCAEPGTIYSAWISLDQSNRYNGGLSFVKGTHKLGLLSPETQAKSVNEAISDHGRMTRIQESDEIFSISTDPGDVIFFDANLVHGSGDNRSNDTMRRALAIHITGESVQKIFYNHDKLMNKKGERVRRRLNTQPFFSQGNSIFEIRNARYFENNRWK